MLGQTISHYKITEKLGEGGMGVVYKAQDTKLRRTVALKFPPIDKLAGEEEKSRFVREAQAAAALNHPNICTVFEIDEIEGRPFIAMAFLEDRTLAQKIAAGPLDLDEALHFAVQIARSQQAVHPIRRFTRRKAIYRDRAAGRPGSLRTIDSRGRKLVRRVSRPAGRGTITPGLLVNRRLTEVAGSGILAS